MVERIERPAGDRPADGALAGSDPPAEQQPRSAETELPRQLSIAVNRKLTLRADDLHADVIGSGVAVLMEAPCHRLRAPPGHE